MKLNYTQSCLLLMSLSVLLFLFIDYLSSTIPTSSFLGELQLIPWQPSPFELTWSEVPESEALKYFTKTELDSIPYTLDRPGTCKKRDIASQCCLGTYSFGGGNSRNKWVCFAGINATENLYIQRFPVPYMRRFSRRRGGRLYDMSDVLNVLRNKTMLVVGDSVMNQMWDNMLCDIGRTTGWQINITNHLRQPKLGKYGTENRLVSNIAATNTTLMFHREYKFSRDGLTIKESCTGVDVLLLNYGLHWNDIPEDKGYSDDMQLLGRLLIKYCKGVTLVFRGSTAQHFLTKNGYYAPDDKAAPFQREHFAPEQVEQLMTKGDTYHAGCAPLFSEPNPSRDDVAMESFRSVGFTVVDMFADPEETESREVAEPVIYFIPFERLTQERYNFHTIECTHFCNTPHFWSPVYDSLYRVFGKPFTKQLPQLHVPPPWKEHKTEDPMFQIPEFRRVNPVYEWYNWSDDRL